MAAHRCHAIWCVNLCPPAMLCCRTCWALVSPATQREVYRTVKLRDMGAVDATWAPWWRAQAAAIHEIAIAKDIETKINASREGDLRDGGEPVRWTLAAWLARELKTATDLEARG